ACVVLTISLILSNLRDRAIAENEQQLLTTAVVLSRQAARDFQAQELVELALIERMETLAIVSSELYARAMSGHDPHLMLRDKLSGFPHIEAGMMVGADGKLTNSSHAGPVPDVDVSGHGYFPALASNPQLSAVVGEPVRDPATGEWTTHL